jgi:Cof subfamily protein (haloacid dehalogenase superfamily)
MIKAIFFDIDGTLVSFKTHRMPDTTREALCGLKERGVLTFVATGRHLSVLPNLGDWVPDGYVTLNGGVGSMNGKTLFSHPIDPRDIDTLTARMVTEELSPFIFVGTDGMMMIRPNAQVDEMLGFVGLSKPRLVSLEDIREMEIFQLMGFFGTDCEAEMMRMLPHCHPTRWSDAFTDIVPLGINKWAGISKLIEILGITPEETMAFGDGGNDIEMLRGSGIGVAMGNAEESVKREADYVTTSVDRGGIAKALKFFRIL